MNVSLIANFAESKIKCNLLRKNSDYQKLHITYKEDKTNQLDVAECLVYLYDTDLSREPALTAMCFSKLKFFKPSVSL